MSAEHKNWGPYTEYGPAHEKAMKLQREGFRNLRIDKKGSRWWISGVMTSASKRDVSPSGDTAVFYSGDLTIRLKLRDDSESYRVVISKNGQKVWSGVIGAPRAGFGGHAYDSRRAYMKTAKAALAFAEDEKPGLTDTAVHGERGYVLRTYTASHRGGRGHR